jgi:hypothetical protein
MIMLRRTILVDQPFFRAAALGACNTSSVRGQLTGKTRFAGFHKTVTGLPQPYRKK